MDNEATNSLIKKTCEKPFVLATKGKIGYCNPLIDVYVVGDIESQRINTVDKTVYEKELMTDGQDKEILGIANKALNVYLNNGLGYKGITHWTNWYVTYGSWTFYSMILLVFGAKPFAFILICLGLLYHLLFFVTTYLVFGKLTADYILLISMDKGMYFTAQGNYNVRKEVEESNIGFAMLVLSEFLKKSDIGVEATKRRTKT